MKIAKMTDVEIIIKEQKLLADLLDEIEKIRKQHPDIAVRIKVLLDQTEIGTNQFSQMLTNQFRQMLTMGETNEVEAIMNKSDASKHWLENSTSPTQMKEALANMRGLRKDQSGHRQW